ncbi:thaumatin-like protein 1 [Rutidosis leptorrhynchoides]|uniref:thaumatin-like protein 1 n=1 Tax=Rutidosis leptorrhynchoides TaxID=125765 RepID=UPI003A9A5501
MATHYFVSCHCCITFFLLVICKGIMGTSTFTFKNRCDYIVWPGILSSAGSTPLDSTGFELSPGESRSFQATPGWSGRFWGRTGCTFDANGQGSCATGDCGSNQMSCNGAGATPPATLAEFTIGSGSGSGSNALDFYDVSLVDGYNLPMAVDASGGTGACGTTGCVTDLNRMCPNELRAGDGQACKSACEAFGNPEYCCSGSFGSPDTCRPSVYSEMFKSACPRSYSYAYDDATSTFTCMGASYTITFCPGSTSQKSSTVPSVSSGTTTNAPPMIHRDPEPQGDPNGSSWLPSFSIGGSSRGISSNAATLTLTSFIVLFFQI